MSDDLAKWLFDELAKQAKRDVTSPANERDQFERTLLALYQAAMAWQENEEEVIYMIHRQMMRLADIDNGYTPGLFVPENPKGGKPALYETGMRRLAVRRSVDYLRQRDGIGIKAACRELSTYVRKTPESLESDYNTDACKMPSNTIISNRPLESDNHLESIVKYLRMTP